MEMIETFCPLCSNIFKIPKEEQFLEERGYVLGAPGNVCPRCQRFIHCEEEIQRLKTEKTTAIV